jgi:Arc/MetJ-type ribon-helix-helix transcriptional regulator
MYALPAAIDKEIKALIKEGYYTNINEAARNAFRTLLNVLK